MLHKESDAAHTNLTELKAANKTIKVAVAWRLKNVEIITDSAPVFKWLTNAIRGDGAVKSSGMSELLVKRRICTIKQIIEEEQLLVKWKLIGSAENRADCLTLVPSDWLIVAKEQLDVAVVTIEGEREPRDSLKMLQKIYHFGVRRMSFLAKKL